MAHTCENSRPLAMALHSRSLILCFTVVAAMLLLADATPDHMRLSPDVVAGLTQRAHLRGNTLQNAPGSKKEAVVTGDMYVGDRSLDAVLAAFDDYRDGAGPSANCRRRPCRRRP